MKCKSCGISGMDVSAIANRYGGAHVRLSKTLLCRDSKKTDQFCPSCVKQLFRVTLSWGSTFVELEECETCGRLYLDQGELERIGSLVGVAERRSKEPAWGTDLPESATASWLDELFGSL